MCSASTSSGLVSKRGYWSIKRQKNGLDYLPWEVGYRQGDASSFEYCTAIPWSRAWPTPSTRLHGNSRVQVSFTEARDLHRLMRLAISILEDDDEVT